MKKKYEGKYFVYQNGANGKHWPLFVKVLEVDDTGTIKYIQLEKSYNGDVEIKISTQPTYRSNYDWFLAQEELTKEEFNEGLTDILKELEEVIEAK